MKTNCAACSRRGQDGALTEDAKAARSAWGCDRPTAEPFATVVSSGGKEFPVHQCPSVGAMPACGAALGHLSMTERHGVLPHAGGVLDQSAEYFEAMLVFSAETSHCEKLKMDPKRSSGGGARGPLGRLAARISGGRNGRQDA